MGVKQASKILRIMPQQLHFIYAVDFLVRQDIPLKDGIKTVIS